MTIPQPTVTVYTKQRCQQCDATRRWLDSNGIEYTPADLSEERHLAFAKALGYQAAPVVVITLPDRTQVHWSGFNPIELGNHLGDFQKETAA